MSKMILTSSSFSSPNVKDKAFDWFGAPLDRRVAIIVTASVQFKEQNKYAQLTRRQFQERGFKAVDFFDVEFDEAKKLSGYQIIYIGGGNTFYLLYHLKSSGADAVIKSLIVQDRVVYFGTSAGSLILAPTIRLAGEVAADKNQIGLEDLTGLGLVNFEIFPHYDNKYELDLINYENKYQVKVQRLRDGEAIFVSNNKTEFID